MNSFTLNAIGHLAREPEMLSKDNVLYTRFALVANDYGGKDKDGEPRELITSVYFVAFGALGEAVATHARKGDQLIVTAQMRANNWVDQDGEKRYDYSYVVQGFRFGAPGRIKRDELAARAGVEPEVTPSHAAA